MQIAPSRGMLGNQIARVPPNSRNPPDPHVLQCEFLNCLFQGFWELAQANMGQKWLKMALDHLFEHPKWSRNNFGKIFFNHFWTHR